MKVRLGRAFSSLAVRNYRIYFIGQLVSISGNWMQQIAMAWLILKLTGSVFSLGLATALQSLPFLLLGPWGGVLTDRLPKRRLLFGTQLLLILPPITLWVLMESGSIRVWMVYALVICRGAINVLDNPARQSFVSEMVGRERLVNAVSLNASVIQCGRLLGPAVAAVVIVTLGLGPCFLLNAASYAFMFVMLKLMRPEELEHVPVTARGKGQLREGLAHVVRTPHLRLPLVLMAVIGLLSFNFNVVLPALARFTFHGTASTYALMMNFLAAGALVGALAAGTRATVTRRMVSGAGLAFGVALGLCALFDSLALVYVALIAVGATSVSFSASVQSALQLSVVPEMRGRVLALYQFLYQGTTPLGALLIGALASSAGARAGLVAGAIAGVVAGAAGLWVVTSSRSGRGEMGPPQAALFGGEAQRPG